VAAGLAAHPALQVPPPGREWCHRKMAPALGSTGTELATQLPARAESWSANRTCLRAIYSRARGSYPPTTGQGGVRGATLARVSVHARGVDASLQWEPARAPIPARSIVRCDAVAGSLVQQTHLAHLPRAGRAGRGPIEERTSGSVSRPEKLHLVLRTPGQHALSGGGNPGAAGTNEGPIPLPQGAMLSIADRLTGGEPYVAYRFGREPRARRDGRASR
jgi:hypothetical protein